MPACDASTSMCSSKAEGEAVVIAMSLAGMLPRLSSSRAHRSASTTSARGSEHSSPRVLSGGYGSDGKSRPAASVDVTDRDPANVLLGNCCGSIAPWGRASHTRRWSRLISAIRGELDARPSRSMSAVHARSRVCNAARTIPGKPRTSSSCANPPS
jgi:hypothetical protein